MKITREASLVLDNHNHYHRIIKVGASLRIRIPYLLQIMADISNEFIPEWGQFTAENLSILAPPPATRFDVFNLGTVKVFFSNGMRHIALSTYTSHHYMFSYRYFERLGVGHLGLSIWYKYLTRGINFETPVRITMGLQYIKYLNGEAQAFQRPITLGVGVLEI